MIIEVDPTQLLPGDVVVRLGEHDLAGCHCDVRVTVNRQESPVTSPMTYRCARCQVTFATKKDLDEHPCPGPDPRKRT